MKSTEIRSHAESAVRQFRALGREPPVFDIDSLEEQVRAAEAELERPVAKGDIACLIARIDAIAETTGHLHKAVAELHKAAAEFSDALRRLSPPSQCSLKHQLLRLYYQS